MLPPEFRTSTRPHINYMRLSTEAHRHVEEFMRVNLRDPQLRFPPIQLYGGCYARLLTKTLRIGAITVGRHIFVSPNLLRRDAQGRWTVPGWLLAHEATHVMQYEREGLISFLFSYLREYAGAMRRCGWKKEAHKQAYYDLSTEVAARAAEMIYEQWCASQCEEDKLDWRDA